MTRKVFPSPLRAVDSRCVVIFLVDAFELNVANSVNDALLFDLGVGRNTVKVDHDVVWWAIRRGPEKKQQEEKGRRKGGAAAGEELQVILLAAAD